MLSACTGCCVCRLEKGLRPAMRQQQINIPSRDHPASTETPTYGLQHHNYSFLYQELLMVESHKNTSPSHFIPSINALRNVIFLRPPRHYFYENQALPTPSLLQMHDVI